MSVTDQIMSRIQEAIELLEPGESGTLTLVKEGNKITPIFSKEGDKA